MPIHCLDMHTSSNQSGRPSSGTRSNSPTTTAPPDTALRLFTPAPVNPADTRGYSGGTVLVKSSDIQVMEDIDRRFHGWYMIHISSFQESVRARDEVAFLESREFPVFIVFLDLGAKGKWYRVYAGPFPTREEARASLLFGGECDDSVGYFVQPTVIEAKDPAYDTMGTELFGPVLTLHVYADADYASALQECATRSEYALTGAIFAQDRAAVHEASEALRFAAGNFYVNDKPTGAVVGQQPFGGARASGTNDKAGSMANLLRWVSLRALKETFDPPTRFEYPYMREK